MDTELNVAMTEYNRACERVRMALAITFPVGTVVAYSAGRGETRGTVRAIANPNDECPLYVEVLNNKTSLSRKVHYSRLRVLTPEELQPQTQPQSQPQPQAQPQYVSQPQSQYPPQPQTQPQPQQ